MCKFRQMAQGWSYLTLPGLGRITMVDGTICLLIDDRILKEYREKKAMPKECTQITSMKDMLTLHLSPIQENVLDLISTYLKRMLPCHTNHLFNIRIDMGDAGNLSFQHLTVKYSNGPLFWEYELYKKTVNLPELLQGAGSRKFNGSERAMNRRFSLSLKKNENIKLPQGIKRTYSLSQLKGRQQQQQLGQPPRQPYKGNSAVRIRTQQAQKPRERLLLRANSKDKIRNQLRPQSATSERDSSKESNDKKTHEQSPWQYRHKPLCKSPRRVPTLKLGESRQPKAFLVLKQRRLILREQEQLVPASNQRKDQMKQMINAIMRKRQITFADPEFQRSICSQITQVYEKQLSLQPHRSRSIKTKPLLTASDWQSRKDKLMHNLSMCQQFESLQLRQKKQFHRFFELSQRFRSEAKRLRQIYIVDYDLHLQIVRELIGQCKTSFTQLSQSLKIRIGIFLQELACQFMATEQDMLASIMNSRSKFIFLRVLQIDDFQENMHRTCVRISQMFTAIGDFVTDYCPHFIRVQEHQQIVVRLFNEKMLAFLRQESIRFKQIIESIESAGEIVLNWDQANSYSEAAALIAKIKGALSIMKYDLTGRVQSGLLLLDFSTILKSVIAELALCLKKLCERYVTFQEAEMLELSYKIKFPIVMNIDYLHEHRCKKHRQMIEENYQKVKQNIKFLVSHLSMEIEPNKLANFLSATYEYQKDINLYFLHFEGKLKQYKLMSLQTTRSLEEQARLNKEMLRDLDTEIKQILSNIQTEKMLFEFKEQIIAICLKHAEYEQRSQKLLVQMKENEVIYWEESPEVSHTIALITDCIHFIESKTYKNLLLVGIYDLDSNSFISYFNDYATFFARLQNSKLEKIFKNDFQLLHKNYNLAILLLYKKYSHADIKGIEKLGITLPSDGHLRLLSLLRKYEVTSQQNYQRLLQIYKAKKQIEFWQMKRPQKKQVELKFFIDKSGIERIFNSEELMHNLSDPNEPSNINILNTITLAQRIANQFILFLKILAAIKGNAVSLKGEIIDNALWEYKNVVQLPLCEEKLEMFLTKIQAMKFQYLEILYLQKSVFFAKLCLLPLQELLQLEDWSTEEQIRRNVKILYNDVDEVLIKDGIITELLIGKDRLVFPKPINLQICEEGEQVKLIQSQINLALRSNTMTSEQEISQMKILDWHIYFTQQVECRLLTEGRIYKLKFTFLEVIKEIQTGLRYQLSFYIKALQIEQLNMFVNYIDKIAHVGSADDFDWVSTVRSYERLKQVTIEQNGDVYQYGFELKKPQNYCPSFQLERTVSYGLLANMFKYLIGSYILGQPNFYISNLDNYGLRDKIGTMLSIARKFSYFVRIEVCEDELEYVNLLHQSIFWLKLKSIGEKEQEKINLPILFVYQAEEQIPAWLAFKRRNFRANSLLSNFRFTLLLALSHYEKQFRDHGIVIDELCQFLGKIQEFGKIKHQFVPAFAHRFGDFLANSRTPNEIRGYLINDLKSISSAEQQNLADLVYAFFTFDRQDSKIGKDAELRNLVRSKLKAQRNHNKNIVLYGSISFKTHEIQEYLSVWEPGVSQPLHVEGFLHYLQLRKSPSQQRYVVEDRSICFVDPQALGEDIFIYTHQLCQTTCQQYFRANIAKLLEGYECRIDPGKIEKIFGIMYHKYLTVAPKSSLLAFMSIAIRVFSLQLQQGTQHVRSKTYQQQRLIIRSSFALIVFQILYYSLGHTQRRQFIVSLDKEPALLELKLEKLANLTCLGMEIEKISNVTSQHKIISIAAANYSRQMALINKYIDYGQNIALLSVGYLINKFVRTSLEKILPNTKKIHLTIIPQHIQEACADTQSQVVYIIEDLHLALQTDLVQLKAKVEQQFKARVEKQLKKQVRIFLGDNTRLVSPLLTEKLVRFIFDQEISVQEVYKYQIKLGVSEDIVNVSRLLYSLKYFKETNQFVQFLLQTTEKCNLHYYKKPYTRAAIFRKLTLDKRSSQVIEYCEKLLSEQAGLGLRRIFLADFKAKPQEISYQCIQKQLCRIMCSERHLLQEIAHDYESTVLPFALAHKKYIIKQHITLLPFIVAKLLSHQYYVLKNVDFINSLTTIFSERLLNDEQFFLIVEEPLASDPLFLQLFVNILKKVDVFGLSPLLPIFVSREIEKYEFIHSITAQNEFITAKINQIIFGSMRICLVYQNSNFVPHIPIECASEVVYLNATLSAERKAGVARRLLQRAKQNCGQKITNWVNRIEQLVSNLVEQEFIEMTLVESLITQICETVFRTTDSIEHQIEVRRKRIRLAAELQLIKVSITQELQEISEPYRRCSLNLQAVMQRISVADKSLPTTDIYNENLRNHRNNCYKGDCDESGTVIWADSQQQLSKFISELQGLVPLRRIVEGDSVIIIQMTAASLSSLISDFRSIIQIEQLLQRYYSLAQCLIFKYLRTLVAFVDIYLSENMNSEEIIEDQCYLFNYFEIIDLSIELKREQQTLCSRIGHCHRKTNSISKFMFCLKSIGNLQVDEETLRERLIERSLNLLIKNYATQSECNGLNVGEAVEKCLPRCSSDTSWFGYSFEDEVQQYRQSILNEKENIIVYDPYDFFTSTCFNLRMKIIHICSQKDVELLRLYNFPKTTFVVEFKGGRDSDNVCLIEECLQLHRQKHVDIFKNSLEKFVILVRKRQLLAEMHYQFTMVSFDFTFQMFRQLLPPKTRKDSEKSQIVSSFQQARKQLSQQIDRVMALKQDELVLYIQKIEEKCENYQQFCNICLSMVTQLLINNEDALLMRIYLTLIQLHSESLLPLNLFRRIYKRIDRQELLTRFEAISKEEGFQQTSLKAALKGYLISLKSNNVRAELDECMQQSRWIIVVYEIFSKRIIKTIFSLEDRGTCRVRLIMEVSPALLGKLAKESRRSFEREGQGKGKEDITVFLVHHEELGKLNGILNRCSIFWE